MIIIIIVSILIILGIVVILTGLLVKTAFNAAILLYDNNRDEKHD